MYEIALGGGVELSAPFLFHGCACMLTYVGGQYPYLGRMGCICLLFEVSTIPLNAQHLLSALTERSSAIYLCRMLFAFSFFVFRILIGVPASARWFMDTLSRLRSGDTHSPSITMYYLIVNVLLNLLNIFWMTKILGRCLSSGSRKNKHGQDSERKKK